MLRSLICNKTLKKVCCPNFDQSENEDDLEKNDGNTSHPNDNESETDDLTTIATSTSKENSEKEIDDKDIIVIAENEENEKYLKNLTHR